MSPLRPRSPFFFFNDTATTETYTLSLHDALPISGLALPVQSSRIVENCETFGHRPKSFQRRTPRRFLQALRPSMTADLPSKSAYCRRGTGGLRSSRPAPVLGLGKMRDS